MIKKISVLLLCSFSIIVSSYSQKFKGGLHLGILGTQVDGDFKGRYNKLGLFTGAFAAFPFHDETMSIQLEINYAQKGSKSQRNFLMALKQITYFFIKSKCSFYITICLLRIYRLLLDCRSIY